LRNWTLRNTLGRFAVTVTVRDTADVAVVASILEETAQAHAKVMTQPPVVVMFNRFSPQGFEFEVSGQVEDVLDAGPVASDIRFAIVQQFKKRKIPFPVTSRDPSST
jgi:small-conductance mechanosensitive channel